MANMLSAMQQFPGMGMGQQMQERQQQAQARQQQAQMMPAQMDPQRQQAQMMPAQMDPQRQQAQQQSASMMPERPQQAFPAVNQSFDPQMQQMMQERQQQALMQESPAFPQQMQQQARQRQMQQMIQQRQDTSPQQMQMQQNNIQRMQQAAPQLVPQQQPTMTGSLGSPIPQDLSGAGSQMMQASQGLGHLAPEQQQAQMRQAFMERSQQGPPPMQQGLGNSTPPMQQAQQFLTPEQMSGQQQLRDPNGPRPQLMGALSSNDLQRQLNRGAVADENVGNVKSEITALNNASFTANQAQPPSNSPPPTPFFNRPEFQGIFGGGSDPRAAGQQQPQPMTGPNPSQIPQAPPQQQMAGGYGLSNYQDDKFSKGVMSLPQIQENFYSPPPGNYTAPAIQSPYQMF